MLRQSYLTSSSLTAFGGIDYLTELKSLLANGMNTSFIRTLKIDISTIYDIPAVHCSSLRE